MTIKLSDIQKTQGRLVRETTAPFISVGDDGETQTDTEFRVRYYALSIAESKAYAESLKPVEGALYFSDMLAPLIESLPDIVDDKGKPITITKEVLESLNSLNLQAILKAIREDNAPK